MANKGLTWLTFVKLSIRKINDIRKNIIVVMFLGSPPPVLRVFFAGVGGPGFHVLLGPWYFVSPRGKGGAWEGRGNP